MEIINKIIYGKKKVQVNVESVIKQTQEHVFVGFARCRNKSIQEEEGAKITLEQIYEYIKMQNIKSFKHIYLDQKQYELIKSIRKKIQKIQEYTKVKQDEMSCTFCCVYVDWRSSCFIVIHLGDGRVCGISKKGKYVNISAPEYGPTKYHTFYTMMDGSLSHIRFLLGDIKNFHSIFLFSTEVRYIDRLFKNIEEIIYEIESQKYNNFTSKIKKYNYFIDISVLIMTNI